MLVDDLRKAEYFLVPTFANTHLFKMNAKSAFFKFFEDPVSREAV